MLCFENSEIMISWLISWLPMKPADQDPRNFHHALKYMFITGMLQVYRRITVNSEIFARVLFPRNFAYAKFREKYNHCERIKSFCHLLIIGQSCPYVANLTFSVIRENKILAKIS